MKGRMNLIFINREKTDFICICKNGWNKTDSSCGQPHVMRNIISGAALFKAA
jgi:hypothetical protein